MSRPPWRSRLAARGDHVHGLPECGTGEEEVSLPPEKQGWWEENGLKEARKAEASRSGRFSPALGHR